jgi:hypothetical protein
MSSFQPPTSTVTSNHDSRHADYTMLSDNDEEEDPMIDHIMDAVSGKINE